ncbi:MAG: hypothetical protein WCR49_09785 [Opitutae bacterium]
MLSPARITNVVLFLGLLTLGGYAYWEHQLRLNAANELQAMARERTDLRKQLWARPAVTEPAATTAAVHPPDEASPGRIEDVVPEEWRGQRPGEMFKRFNQLMENPEAQRLLAIQQKSALDSRYSSLFQSLHLSPEQLDKFKSLLVEKQNAVIDVLAAARAQGMTGPENRTTLTQMIQSSQAEVDNTIRETLGEAVFAQYQGYEQTIPQRNTVGLLNARLSYSDQPLTAQQTDQLVQILASTTPAPATRAGANPISGLGNRPGGAFNLTSVPITDAAVAQSQSVLSPTQVQAMQQLQQEQQAQQQLRQLVRNQTPGSKPAAGKLVPPTK